MIDATQRIPPMIVDRALGWRAVLMLVSGYVTLDWVSYFHPLHGLNITPWAPAPALGLVFVLRHGWRAALWIALAIFLGDALIRHLPVAMSLVLAVPLAAGYGAIGQVLRRRSRSEDVFASRQGLFEWMVIIVAGTLVNSGVFTLLLVAVGLIPGAEWVPAVTRHWIGDSVGILVTMPALWMISSERGRALLRTAALRPETLALVPGVVLSLWIAFGAAAVAEFKYFYVLFLPIVWAAARQGLPGAVMVATVIQIGIIAAVNRLGFSAISVLEVQVLTVLLAMLGFFVGVVIDEQRRISLELRHTLRLAAAGEMAGALAHELSQPLTALSAFATAGDKLLQQGDTGDRLRDAMRRIVAESERAGDVVRRLRDFFRTGSTRLELVRLQEFLGASVASFSERARKSDVRLTLSAIPDCILLADRLQLEVVMRNLLANAFEAVLQPAASGRDVQVTAEMEGTGRVRIQIEDSGPGLSPEMAARLFEPFESTKSSGLGLGLVISRAIVDAHGGSLWAELGDHGIFKLVLLVEGKAAHGTL
ncbi:MAG: ATP-binding protein [Betaproteobacteria bacterium]